jgi:hypothetical protein
MTAARTNSGSREERCYCCGGSSIDETESFPCGHVYCYICTGRGHQEECEDGVCEPPEPAPDAGGGG